jgi:hypothetical protein
VDTVNNLVSFDFSCAVFDFSIPFRQKGEKNFGKNSFRCKGKNGIINTFVDLPPVYMPITEAKSKRPPSKMMAFEKKKQVIPRLTRNPESINGTGFRFFVPPESGTRPA